jgi:CspA family cold shock protein
MGKKGRDRGQRRRGFDDDHYDGGQDYVARQPQSFSRRESEAPSGPAIDGVVKWFSAEKGFGFVELSDGSGDVFLHAAVLEAAGHESLAGGAKLSVLVSVGPKGRQVAAVLSVDMSTAVAAPARSEPRRGPSQRSRPDPSTAIRVEGVVKWYNPDKGFGFVNCSDGGKDVFVHASVLERARLAKLDEGQRLEMQVVTTPKGREAISVGLLN